MDRPVRILHVLGADGTGGPATTRLEVQHEDVRVLTEETARAGLERLDTVTVDCLIVPFLPPDLSRERFVEAVRHTDQRLPVLFYVPDAQAVETGDLGNRTDIVGPVDGKPQGSVLANRVRNHARARQRERQLERDHQRFSTLFEEFPEPTIAYRCEDGKLLFRAVNDAFEETFGFEESTVVGQPVGDLIAPAADANGLEEIADQIAAGERIDREVYRQTTTGERVFILRNIPADIPDALDGFAVYTDITDRKQREEALVEREAELEQQKANLQQQKSQLTYQNERLDQFASIVSHDLRNPLNIAQGRLDILQTQLDDTDDVAVDTDSLAQIEDSLERMEVIIDDTLTLARQGKAITQTSPVDFGAAAETAWSTVDTPQAELEACQGVEVDADRDRLLTVFENLFRNAVEHGGPSVTVRSGLLEDGFYVEDDGAGIAEAGSADIFERGYTSNSAGTGFGLAIVEDIVRAHGWNVDVTDGTEGGARFEITGVEFSWQATDLTEVLSETLGYKKATVLVEDAMDTAGIDRTRFDRETAITLLDTIAVREDISSLVEVAATTARKQLST